MALAPDALVKSRIEYFWKIYSSTLDWIKFSDTKAAAVIAANGVITGMVLSHLSDVNALSNKSFAFPALMVIGAFTLYASAFVCVLSLIPNMSVGEPSSIIYFAHVAHKSRAITDYIQAVETVFHDNKELEQVRDQVWALSHVANRKYRLVGWGMMYFAGTIFATLGFIALAVLIP